MDKLVLEALEERGSLETFEFAKELGKDHQAIVGSVKSIHALGDVSEHVQCTFPSVIYIRSCVLFMFRKLFQYKSLQTEKKFLPPWEGCLDIVRRILHQNQRT